MTATDAEAVEEFWPYNESAIRKVARQRGFRASTLEQFLQDVGPEGALYVGSPDTVARMIAATLRTLGATRFDLTYGVNGLPRETLMTNIEPFGTRVAPLVREMAASS
ncbi:hypothetical protein ACFV0T_38975 [Streptomyces sp. NPDC059582]|uniref:hypothetical protein n=1 Tax=Streptomyces sp. NPDC059582 TaxID=3346875 RepID=UPI0036B6F3A6